MSNPLSRVFCESVANYLEGHPTLQLPHAESVCLAKELTERVFEPIIKALFESSTLKRIPGVSVEQ